MYSEGTQEMSGRHLFKELVGDKSDTIAVQIQKSVITSSLNIARGFKHLKEWILGVFFFFKGFHPTEQSFSI